MGRCHVRDEGHPGHAHRGHAHRGHAHRGHAHRGHPAHGLQIVDLRDRPAHGLQIVDLLDHCLDRSVAFCQALGHRHSKQVLLVPAPRA